MLARVIGSTSPWLGLLAMFYLLGLAKVGEPLFLLRMPPGLREIRAWEKDGAAYRRLLVRRFGRLLRDTPLRYLNRAVYFSDRHADPQLVCRRAEAAEASHFVAALAFAPYIGYVWLTDHARLASLFLLVEVVFNIYPILHLRIVRARLDHLLQRRRQRPDRHPEQPA